MSATGVDEMQQQTQPDVQQHVRWLDDEQQQHWRAFRDGTARLMAVLAHELEAASGLSLNEYEVLVRLSETPGRTMRMSEIAEGLAHSRSRLTHTVRRMEDAGLVSRQPCAEDARGVNCTMTETGWQALVAAAPGHVHSVREHLVDRLSAEQFRALGEAMDVVRDALVAPEGACAAAEALESGSTHAL
ncbi:MarR family winged helix-turn-helix transcriptional regulator [Cellulomonas soli]|uniref:MarR family transcriptional regulator n=1 Tax=Cellulomonas soli TaxID=931535 RepID=A0A512PG69_9CELL|nr:MarR family transcriptional regulator [Cellulomonas soli]NYI58059.1 DNA-binding MarR family transcriptional regulator [Cellulomonas soli]GEP70194.1 MarR family transcriptional regulator [Cellulomonas soli]